MHSCMRTKFSRFFSTRKSGYTRATAAPRAFSRHLLVSSLGHLRIKREKRDTCPIRSFLPTLAMGFTSHPREPRNALAIQGPQQLPPPPLSGLPLRCRHRGRRSRPAVRDRAQQSRRLLTPPSASPAFLAFPLRSRDFAMAVYSRGRRPSADLSDWASRNLIV